MRSFRNKPKKLTDPLGLARSCIENGKYTVTYHSKIRQLERVVPLPDVLYAIQNGRHERAKDTYEPAFEAWNYSIRGKSSDGRGIRVIISYDQNTELLIITVIVLDVE